MSKVPSENLNDQERDEILECQRLLLRLKSILNVFKEDNKIFKNKFIFDNLNMYIEVPNLEN